MKIEICPLLYLRKVVVKYQINKIHGWHLKGDKGLSGQPGCLFYRIAHICTDWTF